MDHFILGASIFFFAASIALNAYTCKLLNRAIDALQYMLHVLDDLPRHEVHYRRKGLTDD